MTGTDYREPEDFDPSATFFNMNAFQAPEGKVVNLNRYLRGIYIDKRDTDHGNEKWKKQIEIITAHPKFLGFF